VGLPLKGVWRDELDKVSHREYSTGFYFDVGGPGHYCGDSMYRSVCQVVAVVVSCDAEGYAVVSQRNKFLRGDELELLTPMDEPVLFSVRQMVDSEGNELDAAPHPMMELRLKLPMFAPQYSILRKYKNS